MSKKLSWLIGVVVLIVLFVLFRNYRPEDQNLDMGNIKIGADFALTSFGASWAENELKGAQLAVKEINQAGGVLNRNLELIAEDNASGAKGSVSAANKLISVDGVKFLLTGWSDQTEPIIPIITQNKIVTVTVSAGATGITKGSPYLFRTWPADSIAVKSLVEYSKDKGFKKIAVVNSIGAWEHTLVDTFKTLATQNGISVSDSAAVQIDTQDFKTLVVKLKTQNPDAIFIPITSGPIERFVKQAGELGLNIPLMYPVDLTAIGVPEKVPAQYLKNLIYTNYASSREWFVASYKKEYGQTPGVSADTAYDAIHMIARAIEKAGTTDVDDVMSSFTPFDGASGKIVFDENRDRTDAEVILMGFNGSSVIPSKIK